MSQPLLGRCKHCDYTLFVAPELADAVPSVETLQEIKEPGTPYQLGRSIFARCDQRHAVFPLRRIEGTYSPDHKCDSRCMNARGWKCRCSCGGANHGRGYAVAVHEAHAEVEMRFLGEVDKHITGQVKIVRTYEGGSGTIYTFMTLDDTAKLTWFAPVYADPSWKEGETFLLRAKVKRHENDPKYGKSTIVTYVERIES
jgi:hypothetical protein